MFKKESECKKNNNISELIKAIVGEFFILISNHVQLLKYDIKHEIKNEIISAINLLLLSLLCIFTGFCGLIFLGFFFVVLLATIMPLWIAILLISILYFIISLILLIFAFKKTNIEKLKHNLNLDGD